MQKITVFLAVFLLAIVAYAMATTIPALQQRYVIGLLANVALFILLFTRPTVGIPSIALTTPIFNPWVTLGLVNMYLHQWVLLVGLLLASAQMAIRRRGFRSTPLDIPVLLFVICMLLSLKESQSFQVSLRWMLYVGIFFSAYYLTFLTINSRKAIRMTFIFLFISTVTASLLGFMFTQGQGRLGTISFQNPNAFGNFLALVLPMVLAVLFFSDIKRKEKVGLILITILLSIALIRTYSRSSWIGFFCGSVSLAALRPNRKLVMFLLLFLIVILLIPTVQERLSRLYERVGLQVREIKIEYAWTLIKEKPISGHGVGSFQYYASRSSEFALYGHTALENQYLLLLVEEGIIGLVLFHCIIAAFLIKALHGLKKIKDKTLIAVVLGGIATVVSSLGIGIGEACYFFPKVNWILGIIMALTLIVVDSEALLTSPPEKQAHVE